ncbi:hypothetical protein D3C86_1932950 [compost metagenome]
MRIDTVMLLAAGIGRAGDDASHEDEALVVFEGMAGAVDQRVLAYARGADDQDQ